MGKVDKRSNNFKIIEEKFQDYYREDEEVVDDYEDEDYSYVIGSTGCGICSLKRLKDAGVTHLKVVGRGNSIDNMEKDIQALRKALDILEKSKIEIIENMDCSCENNIVFEQKVKNEIFEGKCSGECYY